MEGKVNPKAVPAPVCRKPRRLIAFCLPTKPAVAGKLEARELPLIDAFPLSVQGLVGGAVGRQVEAG
jgi:hypothetical protein